MPKSHKLTSINPLLLLIISSVALLYGLDANIFGLSGAFLAYIIVHHLSKNKDKSMMHAAVSSEPKVAIEVR